MLLLHSRLPNRQQQSWSHSVRHAHLRVHLHRHRPIRRCVCSECNICLTGESTSYWYSGLFLRSACSICADPRVLALLDLLAVSSRCSLSGAITCTDSSHSNPFNYVIGALLVFADFDKPVHCRDDEFARFNPTSGQTCMEYMAPYLSGPGSRNNLTNPNATSDCRVCVYQRGSDYLYSVNLLDYYFGWRDAAICVIFALSSYAMVYLLMKLRTKASKAAE